MLATGARTRNCILPFDLCDVIRNRDMCVIIVDRQIADGPRSFSFSLTARALAD